MVVWCIVVALYIGLFIVCQGVYVGGILVRDGPYISKDIVRAHINNKLPTNQNCIEELQLFNTSSLHIFAMVNLFG